MFNSARINAYRREAASARKVGNYLLVQRLGGGGMGEVFLARHRLLKRPCAVKLIRPERAADATFASRFEREVAATTRLNHPAAVQVYDYGRTDDGHFYYVMEYLPGLTLDEVVAAGGPMPPARVVHILRQVCGALRAAHRLGLVHRDVKPGNIMACRFEDRADVAKLLDFGLVVDVESAEDQRLTQVGGILGTPAYMSPEQARGESDVGAGERPLQPGRRRLLPPDRPAALPGLRRAGGAQRPLDRGRRPPVGDAPRRAPGPRGHRPEAHSEHGLTPRF